MECKDPNGAHGRVCEGDWTRVGVHHGTRGTRPISFTYQPVTPMRVVTLHDDPHGGHEQVCDGDRARVGVHHGTRGTRPISFTYPALTSMWIVTLHNVFLYPDTPLTCHSPSYWLKLFSSQTFSRINTPTFSNLVILDTYPPMKMEQNVPKRRHIKLRRRGITQKKAYNIQNKVKV